MIKIIFSTLNQAYTYAFNTGLDFTDPFTTDIIGEQVIQTIDEDGHVMHRISFYKDDSNSVAYDGCFYELFSPNRNHYEIYTTLWSMMQDFDIKEEGHIPYQCYRVVYKNGLEVITRTIMDELYINSELVNLAYRTHKV